jgi:hypothetical protein
MRALPTMNGPLVWHSTSVESRILTGSALSGPAQGSVWALRHSGIWAGQAGAFSVGRYHSEKEVLLAVAARPGSGHPAYQVGAYFAPDGQGLGQDLTVSGRGGRRVTPRSGKRAAQALTLETWTPDQEPTSR